MKRLICLLLVIVLAGSVVGCGSKTSYLSIINQFNENTTIEDISEKYNITDKSNKADYTIYFSDDVISFYGVSGELNFYIREGKLIYLQWYSDSSDLNKHLEKFVDGLVSEISKKYGEPFSMVLPVDNGEFNETYSWNTNEDAVSDIQIDLIKKTEVSNPYKVYVLKSYID